METFHYIRHILYLAGNTLHNLQGQISSPFQFFIFVLNSLKDVEFLYSDEKLAQ